MYLRRVRFQDGCHYVIRESYREGDCWKSRDLVDLGNRSRQVHRVRGRKWFLFQPRSWKKNSRLRGVKYSSEELEDLFLPFLPAHIRRIIESFQTHATCRSRTRESVPAKSWCEQQRNLHSFDKRRLHFLRCGRVDIGDLDQRPWKFLQVLTGKEPG